ncbi:MAG: tRNA (adenosine(37)-N6)-dimethylallyltransferase MiaA [Elusimicrobiaceae bacterium]|nr:tRNA (adenosine(37)-N6)-dimethylallyltransferase MiaA [Elusimicrobiaceae bacterium]
MKPIVLCGPTASGKTDLALEIAHQTDGIIISADSRQVYKHLTIGTAKPQGTWQNHIYRVNDIPYYLVDFLEVTQTFNAGTFASQAKKIAAQYPNKQLIFAGGTGMYLHAYFVGMDELPPSTPQTRTELNTVLATKGKEGLHQLLMEKDPASANAIPAQNVQRTMRALELYMLTGQPASTLKSGKFFKLPDEKNSHWVYLNWEKSALCRRIEERTANMFDGMVKETQLLLEQGFPANVPALKSLGYPQIIAFLKGELSRAAALERITTLTRQYAKRQRTWFNRYTQAQRIDLQTSNEFQPKKLAAKILTQI